MTFVRIKNYHPEYNGKIGKLISCNGHYRLIEIDGHQIDLLEGEVELVSPPNVGKSDVNVLKHLGYLNE